MIKSDKGVEGVIYEHTFTTYLAPQPPTKLKGVSMIFKWTEEEYMVLKIEFNRQSFKQLLGEEKGSMCVCCGSTEGIEYHHILPLHIGGDNRLSNIQPICSSCHKLVHGSRVNKMYRRGNQGGRKKLQPPRGYESILGRYFKCEIGKAECHKLLGITGKCEKLNDKWWYKEYLKEHGIIEFRNSIDVLQCPKNNGIDSNKAVLGYIRYKGDNCRTFIYSGAYLEAHREFKQEQLCFI